MKKNTLFWVLAVIITLGSAIYQRYTGPTYPQRLSLEIQGNEYKMQFPRSESGEKDARIEIPVDDKAITGRIFYRNYPTTNEWTVENLIREDDALVAFIPNQPPAGKVEYYVVLNRGKALEYEISKDEPIVIRYKGDVPGWVLIPHVLFMFAAMLLSNLSGLLAAFRRERFRFYTGLTLILLLLGGLILGPIVQLYAFGELWTGVPFGWDLTDNKTLVGVIFWVIAWIGNRKKPRPGLTILATVVLLAIYLIPHSLMGSELDHSTGEIKTGFILLLLF